MIVILTEKPSVAKDIAAVVGATKRMDGYFEGNDYRVTYALGHLVSIAEAETMNPIWAKPWNLEQLPMIPDKWRYAAIGKTKEQLAIVKKILTDASTKRIICATDAGREGQLIFDLIYKQTGAKAPVQRFWTSSLTTEAIKGALQHLKPASAYANLSSAAASRGHADWIVGLSASRLYSLLNAQNCSTGRVQTPTLNLIVSRQNEIDKFVPSAFYEVLATFAPGFVAKYVSSERDNATTRFKDYTSARTVLNEVVSVSNGIVHSVVTTEKRTKPPALFDLLTLQKEANKRFGFTAQETLDIAQSLYEKYKVLSYPRTESRHLSTDMLGELSSILQTLSQYMIPQGQIALDAYRAGAILSKAYVDDTKLSDHHAIIPTYKMPSNDLPERERLVYNLVAARFLAIFLPAEVRDDTTLLIRLATRLFRATGSVVREPGWTILDPKALGRADKDEQEAPQDLPAVSNGDCLPKTAAEIKEGKTSAPKPFDDASLLTAMKSAGNQLDDEDLAAVMKQSGLGTPATRAAIIERLIFVGYVERKKKSLYPTEKGKKFIAQVHPMLKDVALTALWEQRLKEIEDGNYDHRIFESEIAQFISKIVAEVKASPRIISLPAPASANGLGRCPKCKVGTVLRNAKTKHAGCSRWKKDENGNAGCDFSIWGERNSKKLTDSNIKDLITKGKTCVIKGFKSKTTGRMFDARLILTEDFKVQLSFVNLPAK